MEDTQVRVDVLVGDLYDLGHPGDGVPPDGLFAQCGQQALLTIYTVEVAAGSTAVTGVEERLAPAEPLYALAHVPLLGEHAVPDVYLDPAYGGYDLLEPFEIRNDVAVHLNAREPFHHYPGLLDAAIGVGGIDPVLHFGLDLDIEVAGDGEELDVSSRRGYPHEHDGVGAGRRSLGRARKSIYSENEDVERHRRALRCRFVRRVLCCLAAPGRYCTCCPLIGQRIRLRHRRYGGPLRLVRGNAGGPPLNYFSCGISRFGTAIAPGEDTGIGPDAREEDDQDRTDQ